MKICKLTISGKVQGVGFRYFIFENANKFGINGYTMNLPNGNVEAILEGEDSIIERMISIIKNGNNLSKVENVKVDILEKPENFKSFEIKK